MPVSDLSPSATHLSHNAFDAPLIDRLDALGADAQTDPAPLTSKPIPLPLDIGIPPAVCPTVGMRNPLAETGFTTGDLTNLRHR